eukprot:scaffold3713_cov372-Prasinococcus_capsulatus_cf.AAC.11
MQHSMYSIAATTVMPKPKWQDVCGRRRHTTQHQGNAAARSAAQTPTAKSKREGPACLTARRRPALRPQPSLAGAQSERATRARAHVRCAPRPVVGAPACLPLSRCPSLAASRLQPSKHASNERASERASPGVPG